MSTRRAAPEAARGGAAPSALLSPGVGALAALSLLLLSAGGCLEADRVVSDDTVAADTVAADTVAADTVAADTTEDTSPSCTVASCQNNDPCTFDWCDGEGLCRHSSIPPRVPACSDAADCDDHRRCTIDSCETVADCGGSTEICVNSTIAGCVESCAPSECDDGEPCTEDICLPNNGCQHEYRFGCVPNCSDAGASSVHDVLSSSDPSASFKIGGIAKLAEVDRCPTTGRGCACDGRLALADPQDEVIIESSGPGIPGVTWGCSSECSGLIGEVTCAPLLQGSAYWVWGTGHQSAAPAGGQGDEEDPAPPQPEVVFGAQGFCLQATLAGLRGVYSGDLALDSGVSTPVTLALRHPPQASAWSGELGAACDACPDGVIGVDASSVVVHRGPDVPVDWVSVVVKLPVSAGLGANTIATFALFPNGLGLSGAFAKGSFPDGFLPSERDGTVSLLKRP